MPSISRDELRDQLRRREVAPVYTLFGEETYLRDLAAAYIADLCFGEGDLREFNETEFNLDQPDNLISALAAAEQLPMMAAKRVIRVNGVRVASASNRDSLKEDLEDAIGAYLANPPATTVLIFVADELSRNRKLGKLLTEQSNCVEFERLNDNGLRQWTQDRFKELKTTAEPDAVGQLVELAGNDLRRLANEIDKLAAASLPNGRITAELVTSLVPYTREFSNFAVTDDLLAGRKGDALKSMKKILDDGTEPLALLGIISYNYRRLLIASDLFARGETRGSVVSAAKAFGPGQDVFLSAARRFETEKLAIALKRIAETDLAIKTSIGGSGPAGARLQIEMLVCELALL